MKRTCFLVPHYIGALQYLESLIPTLESNSVPVFILIGQGAAGHEMADYLEARRIRFYQIGTGPQGSLLRYRLSRVWHIFRFKREANRILRLAGPHSKLILTKDSGFYGYVISLANRAGLETLFLQWAFTSPSSIARSIRQYDRLRHKVKCALERVLGVYQPWKGFVGGGSSRCVGVLNQPALEMFASYGVQRERLRVFGHPDIQLAAQATREVARTSTTGRQVVLFTVPFNRKDITILTDQEQLELVKRMILDIKAIVQNSRVILKSHPAEDPGFYEPLAAIPGVEIAPPEVDKFVLCAKSDLVVSYVSTAALIPMVQGKSLIAHNLLKIPAAFEAAPLCGIDKVCVTEQDVRTDLEAFASGAAIKPYRQDAFPPAGKFRESLLEWLSRSAP